MGRPKKEDREDAEFAAAAAGDPNPVGVRSRNSKVKY